MSISDTARSMRASHRFKTLCGQYAAIWVKETHALQATLAALQSSTLNNKFCLKQILVNDLGTCKGHHDVGDHLRHEHPR